MAENTEKTSQHYIGSRLSLVSKMGVRYEGVLYSIDSKESTISLAKVRSFGTEDRPVETPIPPCELVFDYIVFKASDIKDLMVCELPGTEEDRPAGMLRDPAIISCSALPSQPQLDKIVPPRVLIESGGGGGSTLGRQSPAFYGRGHFGRVPLSEIYRVSPPPPLRAYVPSSYGGRSSNFPPRRPFSVPPPPMQLDPVPSGPPTRFESDYDFQTANEKFKEAALDEKSAIDAMLSASKQMPASDGSLAALRQRWLEEKGEKEKAPPSANQSRDEKTREDQHLYYDKTTSFFDSISCEDRPKGERNVDWNKERKTNEETFGPAAVRFMDQLNRRNHSNAFADYGTSGGGAVFVNRAPPMPPRVRYVPMVYDSPQIVALEGGARVRRWVAGTRSTAAGGRYRQDLYLG